VGSLLGYGDRELSEDRFMALPSSPSEDALFERVSNILEAARGQVARSVNTAMVHAYWLIGREIVEHEQGGEDRAGYGERVVERLARRLTSAHGRGFGKASLWRMRQFFQTWPQGSALLSNTTDGVAESTGTLAAPRRGSGDNGPAENLAAARRESGAEGAGLFPPVLGWTHYRILMKVGNPEARAFYEIEAVKEDWSTRELERQIASLLYDRLAMSRNKDAVRALARDGLQVVAPGDVIKDPFVLEFLGQDERSEWRERDLEQAIIDHLGHFLLELGKGFCFVARQRRITLEGDHFYVDLVFYNRLLRCFVLIELKMGKLSHQDLGQMLMYVNWFDRFQRQEWEQPTVGILLCSEKNDAMVEITLGENSDKVIAAAYKRYLPTVEELRSEVVAERERIERARRLVAEGEE
jgi:predicted nuclease of restriction endonuclease-like (RecB) superfamily